jgi:hypothetical protein
MVDQSVHVLAHFRDCLPVRRLDDRALPRSSIDDRGTSAHATTVARVVRARIPRTG